MAAGLVALAEAASLVAATVGGLRVAPTEVVAKEVEGSAGEAKRLQ